MDFFTQGVDIIIKQFQAHPIAQTIGFIALFVAIYNFVFCKDRKFIIVTGIMSLFWGVHYIGIGAVSAGMINFFDVFKNFAALKWERNKKWMWAFIISYLLIGLITFFYIYKENGGFVLMHMKELIPVFLGVLSTYLVFYVRGMKIKLGFLVVVIFWLVYNVLSGSLGGVVTDLFILLSSIVGISKDIVEEKKNNNSLQEKK